MSKLINFMLQTANILRNEFWELVNAVTIGVRVIAIKDQKILLVRHTYKSNWHLPGGGIKRKETLYEAASRELYEETGVKVDKLTFGDVYTNFSEGRTDHVVVFWGNIVSLEFVKNHEIAEAVFFNINQIPNDIDTQCGIIVRNLQLRHVLVVNV